MNMFKVLELIDKYAVCSDCGNDLIAKDKELLQLKKLHIEGFASVYMILL